MKASELREMSDEQLGLTLKDLTKNLFHLRFQSATERLETPSQIQKARRDIARIKTVQRERQRSKAKTAPAVKTAPTKPAPAAKPAAPAAKPAAPAAKPATAAKPAPAAKKEK